ncbi:SNO glutamine amidotransferase [Gymnopus androsaceus JB14]|uniref:glutaminase n=1 Tax=Gymnopus androsaceus JB14 TaxID=1447944 RepID=A0A6A4HHC8_9AGAR|nr:SNO glutamine amidotransferase [Gymnopus androsaceus JB14]
MAQIAIGILALQGAFAEHKASLHRLDLNRQLNVILVRNPSELSLCDALIIPGGESTTIALLARLAGLLEPLKEFSKTKPVWGTCAGAILLSESVVGAKKGGQELLGGISIKIARNGWGSQVESFEASLELNGLRDSTRPFQAFFIRAPVVLELSSSSDNLPITIVARIPLGLLPPSLVEENMSEDDPRTIVALRQGRHLLTTFHPELTEDDRFHEYFVRNCVLSV